MPDMIPVGNTGIQPNPLGSISGMIAARSGMIGLQQQQQTLQTGKYVQQQEQSAAQNQQQQMQERQLLQKTLATGKDDQGNPIKTADGEIDPTAMSAFAMRALPLTGPGVVQSIVKTQNDRLDLSKAALSLNQAQRGVIGGVIGAAVGTEQTSQQIYDNATKAVGDDPSAQQALHAAQPLLQHLDNIPPGLQRDLAIQHLGNVFTPAAEVATSTAASAQPVQGKTGLNLMQTNPLGAGGAGAIINPAPVKQGITPQFVTPPGGVPVAAGAGQSGAPAAPVSGPQPTTQDWQNFGGYNNDLNSRVQLASDMLPRLKMTETAADAIRTGAGTSTRASIAQSLQALGAPQGLVDAVSGGNLAQVQEAEKMMFQTTMSGLRQAMSNEPSRVSEFEAANKVFPKVDTDPRARAQILGFMSDQGQRDFAEQQALNTARTNGTFNPATWQADYQKQLRAGRVPGTPASQVPASAITEGSVTKSKSGKPIVFRNGRWEYQ